MSSGFTLAKVRKFPWVSLSLFCLTYGVFGWIAAATFPAWQDWTLEHSAWFPWEINPAIAHQMSWGFGLFLVISIMILLAAPLKMINLLFGSWIRQDTKAFLSLLGWAFAAVVIVCWFAQFVRFFVLISAGILSHIDLQLCHCRLWQVFVILSILSIGSYAIGTYLFFLWGTEELLYPMANLDFG